MELFQSGLLVHDDIMDRDPHAQGKAVDLPQYADEAARERFTDPPRAGEALGICAGDVSYFLAFELLPACRPGPR